jgi:hypothetical protein
MFDSAGTYFDDASVQNHSGKVEGLTAIYSPQDETKENAGVCVRDVADALVAIGRLTSDELANVRGEQFKNTGEDTAQILLRLKYVNKDDILAARAHIYGFEFRHIKPEQIDRQAFGKLDTSFIAGNRIVPMSIDDNLLTVAMAEPENVFAIDEVKVRTGLDVNVIVCSPEDIDNAVNVLSGKKSIIALKIFLPKYPKSKLFQKPRSRPKTSKKWRASRL